MSLMSEALLLSPKRLAAHPLFQGWSPDALKQLFAQSEFLQFESGQFLFKRGGHCDAFYVIDSGQVQLQMRSPAGKVKVFNCLKAGESAGDAYLLMNSVYRVDAIALDSVRVLKITAEAFFGYLAQQPALMRHLLATLSERLHQLLGDVLTANLHSGTQRVICYLLGDLPLKNGVKTTLHCSKAQIATALNLTPEHFSRILHDLSSRGFIAVDGRHIVFLDVDGLCEYHR